MERQCSIERVVTLQLPSAPNVCPVAAWETLERLEDSQILEDHSEGTLHHAAMEPDEFITGAFLFLGLETQHHLGPVPQDGWDVWFGFRHGPWEP